MSSLTLKAGEGSLDGSRDNKLGIVAVRLKCHAVDLVTAITGAVPDIGLALVETQPRTFSREKAGETAGYEVLVSLEGHLAPDAAEGEEFSMEATTSEDPIETNPNYLELLELYGGSEDDQGRGKWPKTFTQSGFEVFGSAVESEAPNRMHGVESYLVPGCTWVRKSVSKTLKPAILRGLGSIDTPPGNPPPVGGNRSWLKLRARASFRGNVWQVEEAWLLSGPDGWVPEIYRY